MLLVLAAIVFAGSLLLGLLIFWADAMSDALSQDGIPLWPAGIGLAIALMLFVAWWFVGGTPIQLHW